MLERGTKARSVRATQMNKESSRAHTIFEIILKRSQPNEVIILILFLPFLEKSKQTSCKS